MPAVARMMLRDQLRSVSSTATVPRGKQWIVTSIVAYNSLSGGATSRVRISIDGVRVWNTQLAAGATFDIDTKQVLLSGQQISASADGLTCTVTISGVEDTAATRQIRDLPGKYTTIANYGSAFTTLAAAEGATG